MKLTNIRICLGELDRMCLSVVIMESRGVV